MTLVLDTSSLKENLYITNLKLSTPQKSINIDAKDLIDGDIAEIWGTDGARVSFSLNISKRINEFIDRFTVVRRNICGRLMFDGNNYLLFESSLNDYLTECKQLDDEFAEAIEEILADWETVEDDFQFALSEKMRVALTKSFSSHNKTAIDEQIEKSVEYYMSRKFPSADVVRDKCGVIMDTPRLFKQATPKGLSSEAAAAYEKSQQENLKLIHDLLRNDYLALELDVCVGFMEKIITLHGERTLPRLFHPSIIEVSQTNGELGVVAESVDDFDLGIGGDERGTGTDVEIESRLSELKNSDGAKKYSIVTYKRLLKSCKSIAENLNSSIPLLSSVIEKPKLEDMGVMLENSKTFYSWCDEWIKEYELKGRSKKSKKYLISPDTTAPLETTDVVDVSSIPEVEIDNLLILEPKQNDNVLVVTRLEVDNTDDFDLAI